MQAQREDVLRILLAVTGAVLVAAATFAWFGTGPAGAQVAARNTARYSALVFAFVLAAQPAAGWLRAFVAVHLVHYAAVIYLARVATQHHLHQLTLRSGAVVAFGVLLLVPLAWAGPAGSTVWRRLRALALYLAWLTFLGGALLNSPRDHAALLPLLALLPAMAMHLRKVAARGRASASASAA